MKSQAIAIVVFSLIVSTAEGKDQLHARFRPFWENFGEKSTTKLEIVAGPEDVKMRNGGVVGRRWIATCGNHRFKLTIETATGVTLDTLVRRIEQLPEPYMKACVAVSDEGEDGVAVYASLGGARAHGGQGYINIFCEALTSPLGAMIIAHEAGHTLDQLTRNTDPNLYEKWEAAVMTDKISVSNYGDHALSEDIAEFALIYAVCQGAGAKELSALKALSPSRCALWERMLAPAPKMPEEKEIIVELGHDQKMEFVLIPAGEYMMGSHESPTTVVEAFKLPKFFVEYLKNEYPQHTVRITKPFYLGKYEVTQEQWKAVMGTEPSYHKGEANLPVESVSWNESRQFVARLNTNVQHPGIRFNLPTEAQWEYACRAGKTTRFHFGDDPKLLGDYAWYARNSGMRVHPIGLKKPNAWGLHDINGNVHEWCLDWHDSGYYERSPAEDPMGPATGAARVTRGGSFYDGPADYFRCSDRYHDHPSFRYYRYGIRVAGNPRP